MGSKEFSSWTKNIYPELSKTDLGRLIAFAGMVEAASRTTNLIARGDLPRIFERHLQESVDPGWVSRLPSSSTVLDIGSGGGFPGIPLSIVRPDLEVTLMEPRQKKVAFLELAVLKLGLTRAKVLPVSLAEGAAHGDGWKVAVVRGVRWDRALVKALERCVEGPLFKFGPVLPGREGVECVPLHSTRERVVQIWPRERWRGLPGAGESTGGGATPSPGGLYKFFGLFS